MDSPALLSRYFQTFRFFAPAIFCRFFAMRARARAIHGGKVEMFIFSSSSARVLAPRVFAAQHLLLLRPLGRRGQILTRTPASARLLVCIKPGKRKNFRKHNLANGLTPTQKNNTVAKKKSAATTKNNAKTPTQNETRRADYFFYASAITEPNWFFNGNNKLGGRQV
jgi:hypothetical protein